MEGGGIRGGYVRGVRGVRGMTGECARGLREIEAGVTEA